MNMFNLHDKNLKLLSLVIEENGWAWIHGDGNIYMTNEDSNNNQKYSNPRMLGAKHRRKYTQNDVLPKSADELERALLEAKTKEIKEEARVERGKEVKTFDLGDSEEVFPNLSLEDLKKTEAVLKDKSEYLQSRGLVLADKSSELDTRQSDVDAKEKTLAERLKSLEAREAELSKKEAAIVSSKKGTPAS